MLNHLFENCVRTAPKNLRPILPLLLQSWPKYMRQTLVLVSNSALREGLISIFKQLFASIDKIFILGGRLGSML